MIVVTGASGKLGHHVIEALRRTIPITDFVAAVRSPEKAADLAARGIQVRQADYDHPETLRRAFRGADKVLLISSSEVGKRGQQHSNVIEAAKAVGVGTLFYTSVLHADNSPLVQAEEHRETEALLKDSGLPHVLLRHGWYTENYLGNLSHALQHGVLMGCAGAGRISGATRADYAAAAATVLVKGDHAGKIYELAGDAAFTLSELAAEIHEQAGNPMKYENLSEEGYRDVLIQAGFPPTIAAKLANTETHIENGALFDDSHQLSALIGRPTTPLATSVVGALNSLGE